MNRAIVSASRGYASQAAATHMVRPPIALFGVTGRYTNALYSAAFKTKKLDAVEADLKKLLLVCDTDKRFNDFLINPLVNVNQKKQIMTDTLTGKFGACDITMNFIHSMVENRRLKELSTVAQLYLDVMRSVRGEISCTVTTAKPITDDAVIKEIEAALKGFTKKKLEIKMKVDPAIIGGIVVDFEGEHYVDMSMRSKIKLYSDLIKQAV